MNATSAPSTFEHPAQNIAFNDYRKAVKDADERLQQLTDVLKQQSTQWRMFPVVRALMCLRGFDILAATTLVAEIGGLTRFPHPRALMAYLGLTPSEHSSGNTHHRGSITKTGNQHARRILVEAAWNYRHKANVGRELSGFIWDVAQQVTLLNIREQ